MTDLLEPAATGTTTRDDLTPQEASRSSSVRGPINRSDGRVVIGRVGAPEQQESTSGRFFFWIPPDALVEKTQLVACQSHIAGKDFTFYALIEEVHRRSRKRSMGHEVDEADNDLTFQPPFESDGYTYAAANILCTTPPVLIPPRERSDVLLADEADAKVAYGYDEMARPMAVGRLRNGASGYAGLASIDLSYLLGENGGHLNLTGMSGVSTKSSFLTLMIALLRHEARPRTGVPPLHIVPIILNVKGEDLMWIDQKNRDFKAGPPRNDKAEWDALGVAPAPFVNATFHAPTDPKSPGAPAIDGCNAKPYCWALADILADELFPFLFSGDDKNNPVMMGLVYDIVAHLTKLDNKTREASVSAKTWDELLSWLQEQAGKKEDDRDIKMHHPGTWRAVYRRLWELLATGPGIFPRNAQRGNPLRVTRDKTSPPQVIDIHDLPMALQRFVVAAIVRQVAEARTGRTAVRGLRYLLVLDELNRFAPRGSADAITQLLEEVSTEMRSRGVILLGAQQFASQVSLKVVESASIRVLGRCGPAELQDKVWQSWDKAARVQASALGPDEKLVMQPSFRQPMYVKVPYPAWAMKREDIAPVPLDQTPEV